jgi:hypothetical protein
MGQLVKEKMLELQPQVTVTVTRIHNTAKWPVKTSIYPEDPP